MRTARRKTRSLFTGLVAATASLALVACGGDAREDEAPAAGGGTETDGGMEETPAESEVSFDGQTITMIVPYNPGGGFDTYVRLLAPRLEEQLEGARVRVENMPGGGGLIGANAVAQAQPDGTTIGLINYPGAVFAEVTGAEGVTFDSSEWTILNRLGALPPLVYSGPDSEYTDFESIIDSTEPVRFGLGGVGSDSWYVAVTLAEVFGFPNEIIGGYPGSAEADAALLVGEVDVSINSGGAGAQMVEGSGANPIVAISNEPLAELPDVPLILEYGDDEQQRIMGALASMYDLERLVVGPPGMDEAMADALAEAIFAAASSPEYAEEMQAAGYPVAPLPREGTVALADEASASVDTLTSLLEGIDAE